MKNFAGKKKNKKNLDAKVKKDVVNKKKKKNKLIGAGVDDTSIVRKKDNVEIKKEEKVRIAMNRAKLKSQEFKTSKDCLQSMSAPNLINGVVPDGVVSPVAMDSYCGGVYGYYNDSQSCEYQPFLGYQNLAVLATRPEYRAIASTLSTELTRKWIEINSNDKGESKAERIKELELACKDFNLKGIIRKAAEHDCLFGRGHISIKIKNADNSLPLILDSRTVEKGSLKGFVNIEPMWISPSNYNASDPMEDNFYTPTSWFVYGNDVSASRLMTIITRQLPDMLKPAYNFSGMSMSQLAKPYVDNWLRTRQSVSDLTDKFSRTFIQTDMTQILNGDEGNTVFDRVETYINMQSNLGLGVLDKDKEGIVQVNTPLGGLSELQAQALEHLSVVTKIPTMLLTGISPTGLNASSDGEIRAFYDHIAATQEAYYYEIVEKALRVIQLHLWGEIDKSIVFKFAPLWQMNAKEESEIKLNKANAAAVYITNSVLSPEEVRHNLADDKDSGWNNIDTSVEIVNPDDENLFDDKIEEPDKEE